MKTYNCIRARKVTYVFVRKVLKIAKEFLVIILLLLSIAIKLKLIG
ncbi:MAG: hypothetical protein AABZ31_08770 [Bdellovibrionota bacterium]